MQTAYFLRLERKNSFPINKLTHPMSLWTVTGSMPLPRHVPFPADRKAVITGPVQWGCPGWRLVFMASANPWGLFLPDLIPFFPRLKFEHPADKIEDSGALWNSLPRKDKTAQAAVFPPQACPHPPQAPKPTPYTPGISIVFGNSAGSLRNNAGVAGS